MRIAIGTPCSFRFTLHRVTMSAPIEHRAGVGIVVDNQDYSVWPIGYAVRVTESPDYAPGTIVHVCHVAAMRGKKG